MKGVLRSTAAPSCFSPRAWLAPAAGALLASVLGAGALRAQQAPARQGVRAAPAPGFAAVAGIVDDSLRGGRPLAGATVIVLGTQRAGVTDASGIFRIDSIPPGEVQLLLRHPSLDSLLVSVSSNRFTLTADRLDEVAISTPSVARFRAQSCGRGGAQLGPAIVAGRVDEADTGEPLANALVSFVYTVGGVSSSSRLRTTRTNENGFYAICGLPEGVEGTVQAAVGAHASSEVAVDTKSGVLTTAGFLVSTQGDSLRGGLAVLNGKVVDVAGRPVADAQVAVEGGRAIVRTGEDGSFTLTGLPSGTTNASVRKIGFAPALRPVSLRKAEPQTLNVVLAAGTRVLAPVTVMATADKALDKLGFNDRLKMGSPANFLTPDQIAKRENVAGVTDLFRMIPGFIVQRAGDGKSVLGSSRSVNGGQQGCVNIFVDRMPFQQLSAGDLDQSFPLNTIGAIESYPSAVDTPVEFRMSGQNCATVVMWTKMRLNR
ncbi:MAG: carboxypeptidase regulatory-like domain-containing protein [Gemmatimonadaceae bacterium]|nr:carboxypeptidase regulatory-like domain-containing protein [Gemmatimonadaceae bacterium]